MLKNARYTCRVTWPEEDEDYVGLCAECPSLSWLSATPEAMAQGIHQVVADVVADLVEDAEPVPEPLATRRYSGRFMVRIPPSEYRDLVLVEPRPTAEDGEKVVAVLPGGEATLKRLFRDGKRFRLQPSNPDMEPIYTDDLEVRGVVRGVLRRY